MRKILFFALLVLTSNFAIAQAGITITNYNQNCTLYAHMRAVDIPNGNGNPCDISSNNTIILLPGGGTTGALADWIAFGMAYGLSSTVPLVGTPISATFQWSDIAFQWGCPVPPCLGYATFGYMTDPATTVSCFTSLSSWSGAVCNSATSNWINVASTGFGDDIVIDFY